MTNIITGEDRAALSIVLEQVEQFKNRYAHIVNLYDELVKFKEKQIEATTLQTKMEEGARELEECKATILSMKEEFEKETKVKKEEEENRLENWRRSERAKFARERKDLEEALIPLKSTKDTLTQSIKMLTIQKEQLEKSHKNKSEELTLSFTRKQEEYTAHIATLQQEITNLTLSKEALLRGMENEEKKWSERLASIKSQLSSLMGSI